RGGGGGGGGRRLAGGAFRGGPRLAAPGGAGRPAAAPVAFADVQRVIAARCVPCHATQPRQEGFAQPPKGIVLETPEQIAGQAAKIGETVGNGYMPIGNLTQMSTDERGLVAAWVAQSAKTR